jgi:hypothetical protein
MARALGLYGLAVARLALVVGALLLLPTHLTAQTRGGGGTSNSGAIKYDATLSLTTNPGSTEKPCKWEVVLRAGDKNASYQIEVHDTRGAVMDFLKLEKTNGRGASTSSGVTLGAEGMKQMVLTQFDAPSTFRSFVIAVANEYGDWVGSANGWSVSDRCTP